jgi:hypothetical protein
MKRIAIALLALPFLCAPGFAQSQGNLKVFISVDMEGITGVVNWLARLGAQYLAGSARSAGPADTGLVRRPESHDGRGR